MRPWIVGLVIAVTAFTAPALAATGNGSRENPFRLHVTAKLPSGDGWRLRVNKAVPNATAAVRATNQFNAAPKRGRQFFMINITVTNGGKKAEATLGALSLNAVGRSNVAYDAASDRCGVIPSQLDDFKKVFPGGSLTGSICFSVRTSDVVSLLLYYEPVFSLNETQIFFALR